MSKIIFIILSLSFISALIFYLHRRYNSKLFAFVALFASGVVFSKVVPLSSSNVVLLQSIATNLAPAGVFLYGLHFEFKALFQSGIGCACSIGGRRYWVVVALAITASYVAQIAAAVVMPEYSLYGSVVAAFVLGYTLSFTRLREVYGVQEIATTMLYLLSGIAGVLLF